MSRDANEREHEARKRTLYFPSEMIKEVQSVALRRRWSLSKTLQQAWAIARKSILTVEPKEVR